jgi:hypothetical protein
MAGWVEDDFAGLPAWARAQRADDHARADERPDSAAWRKVYDVDRGGLLKQRLACTTPADAESVIGELDREDLEAVALAAAHLHRQMLPGLEPWAW